MSRHEGTGSLAPVRSEYIRELMVQKGVNNATLGRYIGYTKRHIRSCLNSGMMSSLMVTEIARYFRVSEKEIRGEEE